MKDRVAESLGILLVCAFIWVGKLVYHQVRQGFNSAPQTTETTTQARGASDALPMDTDGTGTIGISPSEGGGSDRIGMQMFGCQSLTTFKRLTAFFKNNEEDSHAEEIQNDLDSGQCVVLDKGEPVTTVASIGIANTRVQPEGDPNSYWTLWAIVDRH